MNPLSLMKVSRDLTPLVWECDEKAASEAITGWNEAGLVVRVVRGRKMRTQQALYSEISAALQFPLYFGENADAFDECMADLAWLPPQAGYVVVITAPDEVLAEEDASALQWLVGSLSGACEELSRPVELGEWWDRPALAFHVVLQVAEGAVQPMARWLETGATFVHVDD